MEACALSPHYFLSRYAYIQNKNTAKKTKWEPWDFQLNLLDDLFKYNELVILKARQLGISWLLAGYGLWKAMFSDSAKVLFMSQGEAEAWDMIDKAHYIWEFLPDWLRPQIEHDSRSLITFKANHSKIEALPSTDKAGRGTDATIVIRDECAKHPYARENFSAIGPAVDAGGQLIDVSTIDKFDVNNHFTERVNKALNKQNNAYFLFLGWKLRPVRQEGITLEQWYETQIKPKYNDFEREQEYPEKLEDALKPAKTICRFDVEALKDMLGECRSPLREEYNGLVKIYRESVAGRKYCFPIDSSEGIYDPNLGIIVDADTNEEVAKYHGKIPIDEQARIIWGLYERYGKPYTAVERNASGLTLIEKLIALGIKNWHYSDKEKKRAGWWTSSATRGHMIQDLAEMIRLRQIRICDETEIKEFQSFIRTDRNPDGVAMGGCHDEAPIAWAIYTQIRKSMPRGEMGVSSFQYSD